ncbi:hypothetical protein [Herbiconiux liukaitaii]|uniref:hypothetical protein n=1 Tax=Herbiconiux liukaitaii TaxID=3342799 RepID=UPI0035BA3289
MSPEPGSTTPSRSFGWTVAATCVVLALVSGALVGASALIGLRVEVSLPDPERSVNAAHQAVVLTANQQLQPIDADDVDITPAVPFSLTASANRITIVLDEVLDHATDYRIEVDGVSGSFGDEPATIARTFTTPAAGLVIEREGPAGDELVLVEPAEAGSIGDPTGQPAETTLLTGRTISDFTAGGERVLVAVAGESDGHDDLLLLQSDPDGQMSGDPVTELAMPEPGFASQLGIEATEQLWGFRFEASEESADRTLDKVLLVGRGTEAPQPVLGIDGQPLRVLDWAFLPGRPALVAQGVDQNVVLIDLRPDRPAVPLGSHPSLVTTGLDGRSMVIGEEDGLVRHDLVSGAVEPIDILRGDDRFAYPSDAVVADGFLLLSYSVVDPATHQFVQLVSVRRSDDDAPAADPGGATPADAILFDSGTSGATVADVALTPNGRFAAVEVSEPSTGDSRTLLFDLRAAGGPRQTAEIEGAGGSWAR